MRDENALYELRALIFEVFNHSGPTVYPSGMGKLTARYYLLNKNACTCSQKLGGNPKKHWKISV